MLSALEDHADDPVRTELTEIIRGLNEDEQIDLVAMTWLGRGDGDLDDWEDVRMEASRTTSGLRNTISAFRFSAITLKRPSRNSATSRRS